MSVKGLEESEKIAARIQKNILKSLNRQKAELKDELAKVQYLLSDPEALRGWRTGLASQDRVSALYAMLDETERLYLEAGDTEAARIFRRRMEAQLRQKLTNLRANKIEVEARIARSKLEMKGQLQDGLTEVRREGAVREMYTQARGNGGFFSSFGRPYLTDLVTLETKAAGSKTIGEYMSNLYNQYEAGLKNVFIDGIIRGDSYKTMENNLMKATDITAGKAKLLVRTESNAIFNQSVLDVINDNPLVKGYRFRAVLDSHTSKICQEHDGQFIPKDEVQPGVNYPPLHPNCRSTVTTVLVDEDEKLDTVQRYTKNGRNQWEKVPPGMTYQEYKDKFGFSNSKNPRTFNPMEKDIRDKSLAKVTKPTYRGYVKPSKSSTSRIQDYVKAYEEYNTDLINAVTANTGESSVAEAFVIQAQAEAGFNNLPLQMTRKNLDKEVEKHGYRVLYKKFTTDEDMEDFLNGSMKEELYAYNEPVVKGPRKVKMALRSSESKILKVKFAETSDPRINARIKQISSVGDTSLLNLLAIEYGYDAVDNEDLEDVVILNRTAVIVAPEDEAQEEVLPEFGPSKEVQVPVIDKKYYDQKKAESVVIKRMPEGMSMMESAYISQEVSVAGVKAYQRNELDKQVYDAIHNYTVNPDRANEALRVIYGQKGYENRVVFQGDLDEADTIAAYMYEHRLGKQVYVARGTGPQEIELILGRYDERLRGGDMPIEELKAESVGKIGLINQVESTRIAEDYGSYGRGSRYQMRFLLPESTPAMYINDISHYRDREYELALAPGIKYKVVDLTKAGEQIIVHCVVLENDFEVPEKLQKTRTVLSKEA